MPGVPVELIQSVTPGTVQLAGKLVSPKFLGKFGGKVVRGAARFAGRFFRSKKPKLGVHPGVRAARGGSAITRGKLDLGGGQAFRAGGTSFNVRTAARAGAAAVGVGGAVAVGKLVRPTAAVHVAMGGTNTAPRVSFSTPAPRAVSRAASSPASSPGPMPASSSGRQKRCGCPPGQRMLCFKRKHNPEAEAKRRARRKAARESSKAKTAKRTARAKAQAHARKVSRHTRAVNKKLRKAVRRVTRGRRR